MSKYLKVNEEKGNFPEVTILPDNDGDKGIQINIGSKLVHLFEGFKSLEFTVWDSDNEIVVISLPKGLPKKITRF